MRATFTNIGGSRVSLHFCVQPSLDMNPKGMRHERQENVSRVSRARQARQLIVWSHASALPNRRCNWLRSAGLRITLADFPITLAITLALSLITGASQPCHKGALERPRRRRQTDVSRSPGCLAPSAGREGCSFSNHRPFFFFSLLCHRPFLVS